MRRTLKIDDYLYIQCYFFVPSRSPRPARWMTLRNSTQYRKKSAKRTRVALSQRKNKRKEEPRLKIYAERPGTLRAQILRIVPNWKHKKIKILVKSADGLQRLFRIQSLGKCLCKSRCINHLALLGKECNNNKKKKKQWRGKKDIQNYVSNIHSE